MLAKPWVAAQGKTMEEFKAQQEEMRGTAVAYAPFIIAFVAELVMAWMLAGVLGHLGPGQVTLRNGVISALFLWLGFVVTTMAVNYAFGARKPMLLAIDAGHWLAVLLVKGRSSAPWGCGKAGCSALPIRRMARLSSAAASGRTQGVDRAAAQSMPCLARPKWDAAPPCRSPSASHNDSDQGATGRH